MDQSIFKNVVFYKSVSKVDQLPQSLIPEIAFVGRSNVGKSALLNSLFGRKNLVKVSSTPGKTKLINFFLVNDQYHFVDLPGYGYAKLSKSTLISWKNIIEAYLLNSKTLNLICLLIDSRHKIMQSDSDMIDWLKHNNLSFAIILTKCDKLPQCQVSQRVNYYQSMVSFTPIIPYSIKNERFKSLFSEFLVKHLESI